MGVSSRCRGSFFHAAIVLLMLPMNPLRAADGADRNADAALALACFSCHASVRREAEAIPALDAPREQLLHALLAYKNDANGSAVMHRISKGYSDEELGRIADYIRGLSADVDGKR